MQAEHRTRYIMLGIATIGRMATSIGNFGVPPLTPFIQRDLGLNHVQLGALVSSFFVGAIFSTALAGWLVDSRGAKRTLILGQLVMGSFLVIVSLAPSFALTMGFLFLAGIGQGFVSPATTKAVMEWAPAGSRATAMGVLMTGVPLGAAVAAATLPWLASLWDWQLSLALVGVTILVAAVLTRWRYTDFEFEPRSTPGLRHYIRHIRLVLRRRNVLLLATTSGLLVIVQLAFMSYLVLFLTEGLMWTATLAGLYLAAAHLGGACGRIGWGFVSDHLLGGDRRTVLVIIALLSAGTVLALSLVSSQGPPWLLMLIVISFGLSGLAWGGIHLTFNAELADRRLTGTATSISVGLIYIGVIGGPVIFGYLVDLTESYGFAWRSMALVAAVAIAPLVFVSRPRKGVPKG